MKILGIETSCDETAAAVVENLPVGGQATLKVLSNVVASSAEMHAKTGGVIPENAARRQVESIVPVIQEALANAFPTMKQFNNKAISKIDAIAVTVGPGLIGSLLVGVETAKTLAYLWKKSVIPVNHLVAHIYANWVDPAEPMNRRTDEPRFPALALVVSGGHTDLVLMAGHGDLRWIGGTRDDAAGEAFDKTARLLGLPYPGGPSISAAAENFKFKTSNLKLNMFPRPLINEDNYDWSFSGLKTAVQREVEKTKTMKQFNNEAIYHLAAETQEAIVDCLVIKSIRAIKEYKPESFLLAGGVAANSRLREKLSLAIQPFNNLTMFAPPPRLCTDNAVTVASCAFFNPKETSWHKLQADPELTITSQM